MSTNRTTIYPPSGGDTIEINNDQLERFLELGWTENKKSIQKSKKPASKIADNQPLNIGD